MLDLSFRFDRWFSQLQDSPTDVGRVHRCVVRTGPGQRETPDRILLVPGQGVSGDSWQGHEHRLPGNEVSLINMHVLRSLVGGDEGRMALSGDNLQVDLELSEANLPPGTLLELGEVLLRVSEEPHRPCLQFVERFGAKSAKRVARANRRGLRGRGVLCTVERGGEVGAGDTITVTRP